MAQAASSSTLALSARGLTKSYGTQIVLRGLDLDVEWGDFLIIYGPNGAGKSTMMKVLSTISRPTSGEIHVAGFDLKTHADAIRRNIGVVTHQPLLYGDLTARENLLFHGRMFALDRLNERIEAAAELMGMTPHLERRAAVLSHGMQKRVTLARAILHDPPILLLDEPETGLDQAALRMLGDMMGASARGRRTVIMATHSLERGFALGTRVAILARGRLAFDEARSDLTEDGFRDTYAELTGVAL